MLRPDPLSAGGRGVLRGSPRPSLHPEPRNEGNRGMSEAGRAEAEGVVMASVSWRGLSFEIPRYRADWPFTAVVAAENEKWPTFLNEILPPQALREFQLMRPTERDAYDLLGTLTSALGFGEPGESPASAS